MKAADARHLTEQIGAHKCPCGAIASRLIRCASCRAVVARCASCGGNMERLRLEHCAPARSLP